MGREKPPRVAFQESGGGWGNPLLGSVFDSEEDVPEQEIPEFAALVRRCIATQAGVAPGTPPTDVPEFELRIEDGANSMTLVGDTLRADESLRELLDFIRRHSRRKLLE